MIPVSNPTWQTWKDINAFGQGYSEAQDMYAKNVQNQYLQPTLQQELLKAQYNNQILGAQADLAVPSAQAALATSQAMAPYYNAQTADIYQGKIPQEQAAANLSNVTAQYLPLDSLVKAQNAVNSNQRFGAAYQLRNWLSQLAPAAKAAWIAQNQQQYNDMGAVLGNTQNYNYLTPNIIGKYFPGLNAPVPLTPQAQQQVAQQAQQQAAAAIPGAASAGMGNLGQYLSPQQGAPLSTQLSQAAQPGQIPYANAQPYSVPATQVASAAPSQAPANQAQPASQTPSVIPPGGYGFQSSPDITAITKKASEMSANKDLSSGQIRQRADAALAIENQLNDPSMQNAFNVMSKYSGIQGMTNAQLQRVMSPSDWADFTSARDQASKIITGNIQKLESMPTSDQGMKNAQGYFQQAQQALMNNPTAYMKYVQLGRDMLHNSAVSLQSAAQPIFSGPELNRVPVQIPYAGTPNITYAPMGGSQTPAYLSPPKIKVDSKDLTDANINATAKKYGLTPKQVRQKLGVG